MIDYIQNTFADLKAKKDIWWYLSKQDINSQFRRSKVGSLWLVVNQLCFAFGAGLIWAAVFGLDPIEFIPFIATGFAVWGFVASCFVEGSSALVVSQGYIKQVNMPITVYIMRSVSSNVIRLAIGLAVAVMVVFTFGGMKLVNPVYILPGLVLLLVTGFFVSVFCGLVGAKYRDLSHGLSNVFQLLFVLTPVIYPPELLLSKGLWFAVYFNPLSSFIQIVRVPIVDQSFAPLIDYLVVFVVLLIAIVSSKIASSRLEKRIAYYL